MLLRAKNFCYYFRFDLRKVLAIGMCTSSMSVSNFVMAPTWPLFYAHNFEKVESPRDSRACPCVHLFVQKKLS